MVLRVCLHTISWVSDAFCAFSNVLCRHPSKIKSQQEPNKINITGNHEMTHGFREKGVWA